MVDIIIPAYKAQNFIDKLLASISIQFNVSDIVVTIVNDGYGDYKQNMAHFPALNIKEISYNENRGCGYARQYGIDHTSEPFIIFCDADDWLLHSFSVVKLLEPLVQDDSINCVWSGIQAINEGQSIPIDDVDNLDIWLHGKCYRRNFLRQHKITFFPNSAGEDVGFNEQVRINASPKEVVKINEYTYAWSDANKENRINTLKFSLFSSKKGLVDNFLHVLENARINNISKDKIIEKEISYLLDLYIHYNFYLSYAEIFNITEEDLKNFIIWSSALYPLIKDYNFNNPDIFNKLLNKTKSFYDFGGYKYAGNRCTLSDFIKLLSQNTAIKENSD